MKLIHCSVQVKKTKKNCLNYHFTVKFSVLLLPTGSQSAPGLASICQRASSAVKVRGHHGPSSSLLQPVVSSSPTHLKMQRVHDSKKLILICKPVAKKLLDDPETSSLHKHDFHMSILLCEAHLTLKVENILDPT